MKKVNEKHIESILECIRKTPNVSVETIKETTKISDILVRSILKSLVADNVIEASDVGMYNIVATKKNGEAPAEKKGAAKIQAKDEDLGPATPSTKDFSRFDFYQEKNLPKSRLVLAIVRKIVADRPKITLKELQILLDSSTIQKRYGIVEEVSKSRKIAGTGNRYFTKKEEIIRLHNGVNICCTNQWSSQTLKPLLAIVIKKLNYKVSISK